MIFNPDFCSVTSFRSAGENKDLMSKESHERLGFAKFSNIVLGWHFLSFFLLKIGMEDNDEEELCNKSSNPVSHLLNFSV